VCKIEYNTPLLVNCRAALYSSGMVTGTSGVNPDHNCIRTAADIPLRPLCAAFGVA
jgi:hypothetical protein